MRSVWILWLPHLAVAVVLLAVVVATNLGATSISGEGPLFAAAVYFIGGTLWYTIFLGVARATPAWQWLGSSLGRAGAAAAVTTLFVLLLGATAKSGGLIAFDYQDVFVMVPGMTVLGAADNLEVASLFASAARTDPRTWPARRRAGESRRVQDASFLSDGRVVLLVSITTRGGVFPDRRESTIVALRPDGSLAEEFAARAGFPSGSMIFAGGRLVLVAGGRVTALVALDGTVSSPADRDRFAAPLDQFEGERGFPTPEPGTLAVLRYRHGRSPLAVFDLSGAQARVIARGEVEQVDNWYAPVLRRGAELLVVDGQLIRHRADGSVDPTFHYRLLPDAGGHLELRHLVLAGGKPLVHLWTGEHEYLAAVASDGTVDRGAALELNIREDGASGYTREVTVLEDGRVALAIRRDDGDVVALVPAGTGGKLSPMTPGLAPGASQTSEAGTLIRFAGEVVATGARGEVLVRDRAGGLAVHELLHDGRRRFQAPAWLEVDR